MGGDLKATGKGNLFVIFGEPDIDVLHADDGTVRVHVKGVDVFDPTTSVRKLTPSRSESWTLRG